jgi:multicomponent Na+:H+ antiporter subunit D
MPAPFIFVGVPILIAPIVYVLYRARGVAIGLAALLAALLALLALGLPFGQPVSWLGGLLFGDTATILGRSFQVEPGDRLALAFIFAQAALLFLVSGLGQPSATFLPVGLVNLGLLAAALFVRPFVFAAIFVELGAAAAVFMLAASPPAGPSQPATRGALRYLVYSTLGLPFVLLTGWLLEAADASPGDAAFTAQATVMLMAGFAVLLAVVPFHSYLPAIAEHAPPYAAAFVFSVMRQGIVFLLLTFLNTYPWLNQNPVVYRALTLAGGGMALVGAVLSFGQRNLGRVVGYVMLVDIGAVMLGIGLGTRAGVEAALATLAVRGLALPMWAAGLDYLRRVAGGDSFDALRGMARAHPVASTAIVVGLLSLAGFPLTAGFIGRWSLLYLLAHIHPTAAIFMLLGMASVAFVCARGLAALLAAPLVAERDVSTLGPEQLHPSATVLYSMGFVVLFVIGLFPQWLLPAVAGIASVFAQAGR